MKRQSTKHRASSAAVAQDPSFIDAPLVPLSSKLQEEVEHQNTVDTCSSDQVAALESSSSESNSEESVSLERPVGTHSLAADLLADIEESTEPRHRSAPVENKELAACAPNPSLGLSAEQEDFLRALASELVDKQYRLYTWNDEKTTGLITTNSVLFAAIGFLYHDCLQDILAIALLALGSFLVGVSLVVCLIHVIPRITSGKTGKGPNTRSLRGIGLYKSFEDYRKDFLLTTKASILVDTVRQIYGMADNNLRSARIIKRGVYLTLCGVIAILGALYVSTWGARGHHVFGAWQIDRDGGSAAQTPRPAISVSQSPSITSVAPTSNPNGNSSTVRPNARSLPKTQPKQNPNRNTP